MTALGRVLKAAEVTGLTPIALPSSVTTPRAIVLPRSIVDAKAEAARLLKQAQLRAQQLIEDAERAATELRLQAAAVGRADAVAELAAHCVALRERQGRSSQAQLQQSTELAKILAERLIAEAVQLDPALVGRMAQHSLQQLRDRTALAVRAHPDDHPAIASQVATLGLQSVTLVADPSLSRGELCIDSDLGRLELRIAPGLDRLVSRVRSLLHDD